LIIFITIKVFLQFKGSQMCAYFFSSFRGCCVISKFCDFLLSKSWKTYPRPTLPSGGKTGSWLILTVMHSKEPRQVQLRHSHFMVKLTYSGKRSSLLQWGRKKVLLYRSQVILCQHWFRHSWIFKYDSQLFPNKGERGGGVFPPAWFWLKMCAQI